MQLVIPMSGQGSRFKAAGYHDLKPLIEVEGKPIIAHVLDMFPGIDDVIFICAEEHLTTTPVKRVLTGLRPNARIITMQPKKLGPVYALSFAFPYLSETDDIMVSYCDFTQTWDFFAFQEIVKTKKPAGAVPAYTGFHPHLLRKNLYAGIRTDEHGDMLEIKEKHCFTDNIEDCLHSSGIYYFGSGSILKKYATEMLDSGNTLNGEYYVSMIYPLLLRDNLTVSVPPVEYFMQWGTPEDLEEYEAWSRLIHRENGKVKAKTALPDKRESLIKIPYQSSSVEYEKSHNYWSSYFQSKW